MLRWVLIECLPIFFSLPVPAPLPAQRGRALCVDRNRKRVTSHHHKHGLVVTRATTQLSMDTMSSVFSGRNNRDDRQGTRPWPTLFGMRRSCSECGRTKKRCDGQQPCGRCVKSGSQCSQCTYSKRRWHLPQPDQHQRQPERLHRDGAHGREVMHESTPLGAFATSGMLPMKRFRLDASPATGLVGLQENAFLSDFFGCAGFLPLTTKSHIRETMVKIMTSPASLQQSANGGADCDAERRLDVIARGAEWFKVSERNQLPMDPSTCTFWCAIALGALAKGSPIESVSTYCELAREALASSGSGPANVEVAKAWVILAYLCCFMEDMVGFQEYLALSDSFLTSCIEQGSVDMLPVGFAEIVKHKYSPFSSCGQQWQMKSYRSKEEATPPQLKEAAMEVELYQYVAQSYRAYEQILHQIASNQIATMCENVCDEEFDAESDSVLQSGHVFLPREVSDAIGTCLKSVSGLSFEPLEEAVDRPSVRGGFGGLLINLGLVFPKAAQGDMHAALERIGVCVEVCERYPGLCRSTVGCHLAHIVLVFLAAIGGSRAQAMYDKMRGSYNSFRPAGSQPVPPLKEWDGVGAFCDDSYCRAMDLVPSKLEAFSAPPVDSIDTCVEGKGANSGKGEAVVQGGWQTQSGTLLACNLPEKVMNTVHDWLTEGETERYLGSTQASAVPVASPVSSAYQGCGLKTVLHSDRVESKVDSVNIAPERLSRLAGMSTGGAVVEDAEEDSIGTENWLDVTHGMLDAL